MEKIETAIRLTPKIASIKFFDMARNLEDTAEALHEQGNKEYEKANNIYDEAIVLDRDAHNYFECGNDYEAHKLDRQAKELFDDAQGFYKEAYLLFGKSESAYKNAEKLHNADIAVSSANKYYFDEMFDKAHELYAEAKELYEEVMLYTQNEEWYDDSNTLYGEAYTFHEGGKTGKVSTFFDNSRKESAKESLDAAQDLEEATTHYLLKKKQIITR